MNKKVFINSAIGAVLASTSLNSLAVPDQPEQWEKCAGIAKAGANDCGALDGSHNCAGQAKGDNLDTDWIYLAAGSCEKVTGGNVVAVKPAKK
ncbi:putative membrane protein [Sinobacterium caligoides]|uniref:Putative membrane protein n=1 Tax=Sinobacterium caligoides TaxID=933926 RepID=A0A3N2E084_9GAMM|nr:DUF2282 domain-containing protein [Sinobacterium caligoides]ROS05322.1 putative membrane protein [Sinobacterium caligoides]